jgi:hypothetical protein
MSSDWKTHNEIDHILIDTRWHSSVFDVQSFRTAEHDTDPSGSGKNRERLAVNKQMSHRFHTEMFNLKKSNEIYGKEKCHVEVSNRFAALGEVLVNSAWEMIRENIKISARRSRLL